MEEELDKRIYNQIVAQTQKANDLFEADQIEEALALYQKALELIPKPIEKWEASAWVLTAIGDCYFLLGNFTEAHQYLTKAMYCPGAIGTPFNHLRLGQVQYELGNEARAKDELARAYMGGGEEIFEDEDPKYWHFLRKYMKDI
jgi:tetratricopeptide (TPR) repeat protein